MTQTDSTTTLILIRHGETQWNIQRRFQGHGDSALTLKGREQAAALGRRMQNLQFDEIFASDLGRAVETASLIAGSTGHAVQYDQRLRERNYGVLEGLTLADVTARYPEILNRLSLNDPDCIIPEGESYRQHYKRNIAFVEEMISAKPGATLALVIHGGVLDCLFRYVTGLGLDRPRCFTTINASLSVFKHGVFYGTRRWVIETWGDISHLEGIGQYLGLG
ncbi:MAG: histidine phosphatase family protein [Desulfosarcinaceae bacterium]